jgi:hypothetical protein
MLRDLQFYTVTKFTISLFLRKIEVKIRDIIKIWQKKCEAMKYLQ